MSIATKDKECTILTDLSWMTITSTWGDRNNTVAYVLLTWEASRSSVHRLTQGITVTSTELSFLHLLMISIKWLISVFDYETSLHRYWGWWGQTTLFIFFLDTIALFRRGPAKLERFLIWLFARALVHSFIWWHAWIHIHVSCFLRCIQCISLHHGRVLLFTSHWRICCLQILILCLPVTANNLEATLIKVIDQHFI